MKRLVPAEALDFAGSAQTGAAGEGFRDGRAGACGGSETATRSYATPVSALGEFARVRTLRQGPHQMPFSAQFGAFSRQKAASAVYQSGRKPCRPQGDPDLPRGTAGAALLPPCRALPGAQAAQSTLLHVHESTLSTKVKQAQHRKRALHACLEQQHLLRGLAACSSRCCSSPSTRFSPRPHRRPCRLPASHTAGSCSRHHSPATLPLQKMRVFLSPPGPCMAGRCRRRRRR